MLALVIGIIFLLLIAAAASRYSVFRPIDRYDRMGAYVFFVLVGLPVVIVGLALIGDYVVRATS